MYIFAMTELDEYRQDVSKSDLYIAVWAGG